MADGKTTSLKAKNILVATGSDSMGFPGIKVKIYFLKEKKMEMPRKDLYKKCPGYQISPRFAR
jgi:pyruvate/2-oxoglutarate dehydrogenase complex dihydrolipoamide dehydrogenase (E3) component